MPTPTIPNGAAYMAATLYTGNGTAVTIANSANNPTGVSFAPDFVWTKARGSTTGNNALGNTITGTGKVLCSDLTVAEISDVQTYTAFNSNGFSYGSELSGNRNGNTYVAWQWKAGGTAVSNTSGTITSQVSANTTSGFSVVTYTGTGSNATVGHGLGVAPSMVIVKSRSDASTYWCVYQSAMWATSGANYTMLLPDTGAAASRPTLFNSTQPTSTVFSIGTNGGVNNSGSTYVAYCWSQIAGFSQFGSYTGNGSSDGPFIYTGFRPKFVMIKCSSAAGNDWPIIDTSRATYNVAGPELYADLSQAESTSNYIDIVSNGFKIRSTGGQVNTSATTYIYAAFAENPFKYANAR